MSSPLQQAFLADGLSRSLFWRYSRLGPFIPSVLFLDAPGWPTMLHVPQFPNVLTPEAPHEVLRL